MSWSEIKQQPQPAAEGFDVGSWLKTSDKAQRNDALNYGTDGLSLIHI